MGFSIFLLVASFLIIKMWYDNDQFAKQRKKEEEEKMQKAVEDGHFFLFKCRDGNVWDPPVRYTAGRIYAILFPDEDAALTFYHRRSSHFDYLGRISKTEAQSYPQIIRYSP